MNQRVSWFYRKCIRLLAGWLAGWWTLVPIRDLKKLISGISGNQGHTAKSGNRALPGRFFTKIWILRNTAKFKFHTLYIIQNIQVDFGLLVLLMTSDIMEFDELTIPQGWIRKNPKKGKRHLYKWV